MFFATIPGKSCAIPQWGAEKASAQGFHGIYFYVKKYASSLVAGLRLPFELRPILPIHDQLAHHLLRLIALGVVSGFAGGTIRSILVYLALLPFVPNFPFSWLVSMAMLFWAANGRDLPGSIDAGLVDREIGAWEK